ncbi:MAG: nickel-dependent hydrogenase large subunit [Rhodocyclaceae bacterium]|nr:nickel-dependent hydrogenase large subunit [Rhodocyclaceae bacterium]
MSRVICDIPLNRVEGDLEIRVAVEDGGIVEAWSSGTLYRGFENLLTGRAALDALVITPRICGICTTTHLNAAARCLDEVAGIVPPDNAIRLRNIALLVEHVQSDVRQAILMFLVDFANPAYAGRPWFDEASARFAPLAGGSALEAIRETKKILEIIAILGGQWPHSSFMVPGGVTQMPNIAELVACRALIGRFRQWYERQVLGCAVAEWEAVDSLDALEAWREAAPSHGAGDLGWLLRLGTDTGVDRIGAGVDHFLSFGLAEMPRESILRRGAETHVFAAGSVRGGECAPLDGERIGESIAASHYEGYEGLRHPREGITRPRAPDGDHGRYSYSKAPRYAGEPAETGPLAEAVVAGDPLFADWIARRGPSALAREAARLTRPARLLPVIDAWLGELIRHHEEPFIVHPSGMLDGEGAGLINAARGGLGHWAKIECNRIARYQIITPTAWNGSPRDDAGVPGPWEAALIGTPVRDPGNPVEAGHVIRSFDPCLVCTVHAFDPRSGASGTLRLGGG